MKGSVRELLLRLRGRLGAGPAQPEASVSLLDRIATPGRHERMLENALGPARLRYEGAAPAFDKPLILIGFTNRSGSTLLAEYMRQSTMFRGLGEFANHDFVLRQMQDRGLESYPDLIAQLAGGGRAQQLFGLKASWDQMAMLARWNIPAMFTGLKVVHITRRDPLAQAISYSIAEQTDQWTSHQQANGQEPIFSAGALDRIMREQQMQNVLIGLLAQAMGAPLHGAVYEGLHADPAACLRGVLAFCGVPRPEWQPDPPGLRKQAGEANARFHAAYLAQARENLLSTSAKGPGGNV